MTVGVFVASDAQRAVPSPGGKRRCSIGARTPKEADAMVARPAPTTAADLLARGDDGRWELVAGEPRERVSPNLDHFLLHGRFDRAVGGFVYDNGLGEFGPELAVLFGSNPDTVLIPDLAFIRAGRFPPVAERTGIAKVIPDLVIEILSPSNSALEVDEKIQIYLRAGVRLLWIVNPKRRSVTAYGADGTVRSVLPGGVLDGGDVLPGFALEIDRVVA
jgi:Uma2 family endonuclease